MRILYVEDNETNQALVSRVVRAKRHSLVCCEDGETALKILADPTISLVLLDIELAGAMDGLEVIKTLRERGDGRPVVAVTAYAMMGDRERILEAGCDQYLPKPLVITDLLTLLERYEAKLATGELATLPRQVSVPPSAPATSSAAPAAPAARPAPGLSTASAAAPSNGHAAPPISVPASAHTHLAPAPTHEPPAPAKEPMSPPQDAPASADDDATPPTAELAPVAIGLAEGRTFGVPPAIRPQPPAPGDDPRP